MKQNHALILYPISALRLTASQTHNLHAVAKRSRYCNSIFFLAYSIIMKYSHYILAMVAALFTSSEAHATFWNYDGLKTGQGDWENLDPTFAKCGSGNAQSPISITHTQTEKLPALQFSYTPSKTTFSLDRYTVVSTPQGELTFKEGGASYRLKEMLLRTPSEHDVQGMFYPMELQLVHEGADKKLLIVAIFIKSGASNVALQSIIDHYPKNINDITNSEIDWAKLLPANLAYYAYSGSISYPPCTEGVEIRLLKNIITASEDQLRALAEKLGRNARAAQPILMRTIHESGE